MKRYLDIINIEKVMDVMDEGVTEPIHCIFNGNSVEVVKYPMMPGMDGTETLQELRNQKSGPNLNTPVICLTADAISGAREQYISAGFTDYLTKPIYPELFEEMLIEMLPKEKIALTNCNRL